MRRREFIAAVGSAVSWPLVARAQQPELPVVGFLSSLSSAALTIPVAAFREGMGSLGYEEGKNVTIEFRWAAGHYDRLPALATELVQKQAAVIVTVGGDPAARVIYHSDRIHGRPRSSQVRLGGEPEQARRQCDRHQFTSH